MAATTDSGVEGVERGVLIVVVGAIVDDGAAVYLN